MQIKLFIIYDRATEIKVGAISLTRKIDDEPGDMHTFAVECALLGLCGLNKDGSYTCFMFDLNTGHGKYDWAKWNIDDYGRTFSVAHKFIEEHYHELTTGDIIDVEAILKEVDGRPEFRPMFSDNSDEYI